jgi:hypothetical protein
MKDTHRPKAKGWKKINQANEVESKQEELYSYWHKGDFNQWEQIAK